MKQKQANITCLPPNLPSPPPPIMGSPGDTKGAESSPLPALSFGSSSSPSSSSSGTRNSPDNETKRCLPSDSETDEDESQATPSKKAKISTTPLKKRSITEENILLLQLRDEQSMKWPDIVEAFREHGWAGRKQGLLKNRYKSLKEGTIFWEDDDVDFMHQAIFEVEKEYEKTKWSNVAERMVKLGASRKFPGATCEKKFKAKAESKKKNSGEVTSD